MIKVIANRHPLYHPAFLVIHRFYTRMSRGSNLHNDVFHSIGSWNLMKNKLFLCPGGLNRNISKFKKGLDYPVCMRRNVLDAVTMQLGNFPIEKTVLVAANNTMVGDDDSIERINC